MDRNNCGDRRLLRISSWCLFITVCINALALIGWVGGPIILTRIIPEYRPIAPSTILCFLLLSGSLLGYLLRADRPIRRMVALWCAFLVLLTGIILLAGFMIGTHFETEHMVLPIGAGIGIPAVNHMSPITSANFIISSLGILSILSFAGTPIVRWAASLSATAVTIIGVIIGVGYLYAPPVLHGREPLPVSLPTALSFIFLGAGLMTALGPLSFPVKYFIGPSARSRLMRAFSPLVFVYLLFDFIEMKMFVAGSYALSSSSTAILSIIIIGVIIARVAKSIGGEMDRANEERDDKEKMLKESEEKYRVLASTTDLMYVVDRDCRYVFLNDAYASRQGFVKEQVIGKHFSDFHEGTRAKVFQDVIRQVCDTVQPYQYEHQSARDGRFFLRTFSPVRDAGGEAVAVTIVSKDITELKQAENALRKTIDDLQETRGRLVQAERLAALGQLSAGVAHEILNPLNIVSTRLQLMEMTNALSEKTKEGLQICMDQVLRIVKITKDISGFARIAATHYEESDVNQLIDHAVSLVSGRLKMENVKTVVQYAHHLPRTKIDKDKMEQVILNLINNAVHAMSFAREKELYITTKLKGQQIVIVVSDTGTGIPRNILNNIFDPFFTTKEQGQGTGLGLSISYGIVHDHGGNIWAENNKGEGASFFIELPIHRTEGGAA